MDVVSGAWKERERGYRISNVSQPLGLTERNDGYVGVKISGNI